MVQIWEWAKNVLKSDLKKVLDLSYFGPICPTFGQNLIPCDNAGRYVCVDPESSCSLRSSILSLIKEVDHKDSLVQDLAQANARLKWVALFSNLSCSTFLLFIFIHLLIYAHLRWTGQLDFVTVSVFMVRYIWLSWEWGKVIFHFQLNRQRNLSIWK